MKKLILLCLLLLLSSCSFSLDLPKPNSGEQQPSKEEPTEDKEEKPSGDNGGKIEPSSDSEKQDIAKNSYDDLFDLNNKVYISIDIDNNELQKIENNYNCDTYRLANKVTIKIVKPDDTIIEESISQVGIKMKGNTSRSNFFEAGNIYQNVHFKLSFTETFDDPLEYTKDEMIKWNNDEERNVRDDRTFFGLKKLELKWNREEDLTYSRDIYASKVYKQFGIYAQSTTLGVLSFSNQTFQNENKDLGLYKVYEAVDKTFVKRNFGKSNKDGDLYKASWGSNVGMPNLNNTKSSGIGVDDSLYHDRKTVTYALKTNKSSSDFSSIKRFFSFINGSDLEADFASYMNEEYFITFMAIQYLTGDWDNFLYDSNNYYMYFDNNNLCYFIPYDMDRTFGIQAKGNDMANRSPLDNWNLQGENNSSQLLKKTIFKNNSHLQEAYLNKIKAIASTVLSEENFQEVYNLIYQNYGDQYEIVYSDGGPDSPNNAFLSYIEKKLAAIDDANN